jgi:hypothetical protein
MPPPLLGAVPDLLLLLAVVDAELDVEPDAEDVVGPLLRRTVSVMGTVDTRASTA